MQRGNEDTNQIMNERVSRAAPILGPQRKLYQQKDVGDWVGEEQLLKTMKIRQTPHSGYKQGVRHLRNMVWEAV